MPDLWRERIYRPSGTWGSWFADVLYTYRPSGANAPINKWFSRFHVSRSNGVKIFPRPSSILCIQVLLCIFDELLVINDFYLSVVLLHQINKEAGTG